MRICDYAFDHDSEAATHYCCDELLADLHLLALVILPEVVKADRLSRTRKK